MPVKVDARKGDFSVEKKKTTTVFSLELLLDTAGPKKKKGKNKKWIEGMGGEASSRPEGHATEGFSNSGIVREVCALHGLKVPRKRRECINRSWKKTGIYLNQIFEIPGLRK